jgi:hypothetical protein
VQKLALQLSEANSREPNQGMKTINVPDVQQRGNTDVRHDENENDLANVPEMTRQCRSAAAGPERLKESSVASLMKDTETREEQSEISTLEKTSEVKQAVDPGVVTTSVDEKTQTKSMASCGVISDHEAGASSKRVIARATRASAVSEVSHDSNPISITSQDSSTDDEVDEVQEI